MRKAIFPKEKISEILSAYADGEMTVDDICTRYGVARRTVYQWAEKNGIKRKRRTMTDRKAVYMSRNEVETVLLLIMEGESILDGKDLTAARAIEKRLLDIADRMEEETR